MRHGRSITALGWAALLLSGCDSAPQAPPAPKAAATTAPAPQGPELRIIALGDSLFTGYGLAFTQSYPARLEAALRGAGLNAHVVNAGVSGDTSADGLARLDFTLGSGQPPALVLISLGGNDMLRGLDPRQTRANLDAILTKLDERHSRVVLLGMLAAPNMGPDYAQSFNAIYPALARKHHAALVPFFLAPLVAHPALQQGDHIHPTAPGVEAMVAATLRTIIGALPAKGER